jgi:hypothetical protein
MHILCVTVLQTSYPRIRNYADRDGETGSGGKFRLSTAGPRQIRTRHVITQPQKLYSQLLRLLTAVMYEVAGLTCSFVHSMGLQMAGVIHNNLASNTNHLLFFHVRTATQPTITHVSLCHKKFDALGSLKHVSFDINHMY